MKLAISITYYEKKYGLEKALEKVKALGYEGIMYTLPRYEEYVACGWTDEVNFTTHFTEIGETMKKSGMPIFFATNNTGIYNDCVPMQYENRVQMCIMGVRAAALIGCDTYAIRPVKYYRGHEEDGKEMSIKLTYDALKRIKEEADKVGVNLAIVNADNDWIIGWNVEELRTLMNDFDLRLVIDPVDAFYAGAKVKDLVDAFKEKIAGVLLKDTELVMNQPMLPFMGAVDTIRLLQVMQEANLDAAVVNMPELMYPRFQDFHDAKGLMDALDDLYYEVGMKVIGKERA